MSRALKILIWVSALGQTLLAVSAWLDYAMFKDDVGKWDPEAISPALVICIVAAVPAVVTFIIWLRQVRANAERFCKAPHRHRRGWVVWSWLVPVIAFWYPKQIVDDIVAASTPRTSPHVDELPKLRSSVVQTWWATWIASNVVSFLDPLAADDPSASDLVRTALVTTASSVLTIVCAVYAVRVIQLINSLQASRPWVAWWETDASTASTS